jgi:hypothetical protein
MSTNPRTIQYRTETTQPDPTPEAPMRQRPASRSAPRTFEPSNTGELPPMFETEADQQDR